ncbi:MAG: HD domain-containing protein [Gemmatimonadales bacterium]|nr:HD domain-containing protein [Gemmatimonadales bacterium]
MNELPSDLRLSEVLAALSCALDLTEGQALGHAARTCLIGMRLAEELALSAADRSALFYALLLKDAGCSSNAARLSSLFQADDQNVKQAHKLIDWTNTGEALRFALTHTAPDASPLKRLTGIVSIGLNADEVGREMTATRCERGADIARMLGFPDLTALAIWNLDEHWDGSGHPIGLRGEEIPLVGRITCLAQTAAVFAHGLGVPAAYAVARKRSGAWFDPELVRALASFRDDAAFWTQVVSEEVRAHLKPHEPEDRVLLADEAKLDAVAHAFARIVDAKSPFTFRHSERVAAIAARIGRELGLPEPEVVDLRRAGLLHDIGKLGVSNRILDKNGPLDDPEWSEMRKHPRFTHEILLRVARFRELAEVAASHHERLDGRGYHRGLGADRLSLPSRALAVADVVEALSAERPYRGSMPWGEVVGILETKRGTALDPECLTIVMECGEAVLEPR